MIRFRSFGGAALLIGAAGLGLQAISSGTAAEPAPQATQQTDQQVAPQQVSVPAKPEGPGTQNDIQGALPVARPGAVKPEQVLERRKQYPLKSLAGRLAYEADRAPKSAPPLTKEAEEALTTRADRASGSEFRSNSLRLLHEEKVEEFVARSGFGAGRMIFDPRSDQFYNLPEAEPVPLAKVPESSGDGRPLALPSTRDAAATAGGPMQFVPSVAEMQELHTRGTDSFASPWSFGYVKSIDQVAGFTSHGFLSRWLTVFPRMMGVTPGRAELPPDELQRRKTWKLVRLELTSLLKHDKPRVYISENLPRMEDLASLKTRELSKFETDALAKLHVGEQTIVAATTNRIEMFGALRASSDCRQCHQVPLGTVLGAFSYELRRDPPIADAKSTTGAVQ